VLWHWAWTSWTASGRKFKKIAAEISDLKKTWWDCAKDDMESLGLSQKDVQFRNKWRRRIEGQLANPGLPGKWPLKWGVCAVEISKFCRCREKERERQRDRETERQRERERCRTVAVHRSWYRSLWATTTLAVESPTDLFVVSHWLERSSSRFSVTLLVFSRADHSTSQVLTTFYVVFISSFYWRLAWEASMLIRPLADWSTAVTSHAAVNSDARSIQISSQNIRIRC